MTSYARRVQEPDLWAVDIETGGIEFGVPVIEFAAGPIFSDEVHVLWNVSVRDGDCDPVALEVNRCFKRDRIHHPREHRCTEPLFAKGVAALLTGRVLVAANPQFDAGHLSCLLRKYALAETWSYRLIDIKSLVVGWASARGLLQKMPEKGWGQKEATEMAGLPDIAPELLHTAAGDVEQVRQLARMVLGGD